MSLYLWDTPSLFPPCGSAPTGHPVSSPTSTSPTPHIGCLHLPDTPSLSLPPPPPTCLCTYRTLCPCPSPPILAVSVPQGYSILSPSAVSAPLGHPLHSPCLPGVHLGHPVPSTPHPSCVCAPGIPYPVPLSQVISAPLGCPVPFPPLTVSALPGHPVSFPLPHISCLCTSTTPHPSLTLAVCLCTSATCHQSPLGVHLLRALAPGAGISRHVGALPLPPGTGLGDAPLFRPSASSCWPKSPLVA